jgi:ribokinase
VTVDVVVLGSANLDVVLRVPHIPAPGETVLVSGRGTGQGGKGANQAVAAARCGARTAFLGAFGDDAAGRTLRADIRAAGVDLTGARTSVEPTGTAYVVVATSGENAIVVDPGANADLLGLTDEEQALIAGARVLLCQLEVPMATVTEAVTAARAAGVGTVLNAAPAADLPAALLEQVDVLVVNEKEALAVSGTATVDDAVRALRERVAEVVVTLGAAGARVGDTVVPGLPARQVVDTTGAGDTFCGALAAALAEGARTATAARFGCAAASLSVELPGAGRAAPSRAQVEARLAG